MADIKENNNERLKCWQRLQVHQRQVADMHMRDMFQEDEARSGRYSIRLENILLDYSKHRITGETLELLHSLARTCNVPARISALFRGEHVNSSENRPALHWLLRCPKATHTAGNDKELELVHAQLQKMREFVGLLGTGKITGVDGNPISKVVNIGIGGSDLGPRLAVDALAEYRNGCIEVDFVANLDPKEMAAVLAESDPKTTMFIVVSKTFTTLETMTNARAAMSWLKQQGCSSPEKQLIAVTSNRNAALEFGVPKDQVFEFWDWVGGRYSLWSSAGLSVAISIGMDHFEAMLAGAHLVDQHFQEAQQEQNIPVILALLDVWYSNFFGTQTTAIVPYDQSLRLLPEYLSQLMMESNGKSVSVLGDAVNESTSPVIWGAPGTNAQHAFFQMLHQGTHLVAVDFLLPMRSSHDQAQQLKQVSNCLAQSEALMVGEDSPADLNRQFPGNTPSSTMVYDELTPETLGMLLAFYEHRTYIAAMIWGINPFDQFGVELGKKLASRLITELQERSSSASEHDTSTRLLMQEYMDRNS